MAHDKVYVFDEQKCKKEGLTRTQIETMQDNTENKFIRAYTSLAELGATETTKLDAIVKAMETPSIAMYTVDVPTAHVYPTGYNKVTIQKYADGNVNILTEHDGKRYTKDTLVNQYGTYNEDWNKLGKVIKVLSGTTTINPGARSFRLLASNLETSSNVIPIFTYTDLSQGGNVMAEPPNISISSLVNEGSLWLGIYSHESSTITFSYTIILLGV